MSNLGPLAVLEHWEDSRGTWRVVSIVDGEAVVEFRTRRGDLGEELRSNDPALLAFLSRHPHSGMGRGAGVPPATVEGDAVGMASFPASDPPASWTWDVPARTSRATPRR
jgi:hypothetical protein